MASENPRLAPSLTEIASQRHITDCATEELLCGGLHNSSYCQSPPSGNSLVRSRSIGSTNRALIFWRDTFNELSTEISQFWIAVDQRRRDGNRLAFQN